MEHFDFNVCSFPSNVVFAFFPQSASQSLFMSYVCDSKIRNTWVYNVYVHTHKFPNRLPFCPSPLCPSSLLLHTDLHMHKPAH